MKKTIKLFCDGSVNPQRKIGFGAYFIVEENETLELNRNKIYTRKFENTSSTKLEVESLLWALEDDNIKNKSIVVYTDCQNILGLKDRREKLEKNNYHSSTGKVIKNHELYKKFYMITDKLDCTFEKVKGHKKSSLKNDIDKLFNLVDKASRKALREYLNKS
ncbi:ribonuclease HI [Arcobacter sp. LA11]|uniref:ribonuclease HI n=1 Tax=Arcobacter sp. LA11 TaxID=1898176 RepID=UPI0009345F61|nr:RNase H family protein [Arcobacter sp. LA11]